LLVHKILLFLPCLETMLEIITRKLLWYCCHISFNSFTWFRTRSFQGEFWKHENILMATLVNKINVSVRFLVRKSLYRNCCVRRSSPLVRPKIWRCCWVRCKRFKIWIENVWLIVLQEQMRKGWFLWYWKEDQDGFGSRILQSHFWVMLEDPNIVTSYSFPSGRVLSTVLIKVLMNSSPSFKKQNMASVKQYLDYKLISIPAILWERL
jgi:hypothetical protein